MTPYALDSYKTAELLLLEVRANSEVIMSRTYVRRKAVVIKGLLGRHDGRKWDIWVVKK
jgi:hypothetical protein